MHDFLGLDAKLHSLVIFRNLLKRPVLSCLSDLLSCNFTQDRKALLVDQYAAFTSALYEHTDNLSEYLLQLILEDENFYVLQIAQDKIPEDVVRICLSQELIVLKDLSLLSSLSVKEALNYRGFLPDWKNSDLDFASVYEDHLAHIKTKGYGIFSRYHSFLLEDGIPVAVEHPDTQALSQLSAYGQEKDKLVKNTLALLSGGPASNALLYGDAGTGKSSTIKAVANEYKSRGLRLIEVRKNQLYQLPKLLETLSRNPLKFILFIDDLSFTSNDNDFAALKAILEGSITAKSANVVIYATSNRRHLIKETFDERRGDEIHLNDTLQEISSLSARFGLIITFQKPQREVYFTIVRNLAKEYGISLAEEELLKRSESYAISHEGRSPRTAKQFIILLKAQL